MLESEGRLLALPKAEILAGLAQLSALFILVLPAYGFLVVSHYLANYGLQSIYLPKSQFFAAGFATIVAFLFAPAVAALTTSLILRSTKSIPHKGTLFTVLYALFETLMLKVLYVPFQPTLVTPFLWGLGYVAFLHAIVSYLVHPPRTHFSRVVKLFAGPKQKVMAYVKQWQGMVSLLFSFILGLSLLSKTDRTIFLLVLYLTILNSLCYFVPRALVNESSLGKRRAQLWSIAAFVFFTPCILLTVQGAIYGYLDSGWGGGAGAGLNYVLISLEEQSGILAPCTWKVRLLVETESAYYVTFDHGADYTNAYMIPKSKVSGLFFLHEHPARVLDLAPGRQVEKSKNFIQVRAEQAVCRTALALEDSHNKPDATHAALGLSLGTQYP